MPFQPQDIDPEALKILDEAGFVWVPRLLAFERLRKAGRPAAAESERDSPVIDYEFLRDQQLLVGSKLDDAGRLGQLHRLRIVIQSMG